MCEPVSLSMIALAAAGTAVSAYGQVKQGQYAEQASEYNAKVSEQQAKQAEDEGLSAEVLQRTHIRQALGQQRAAMASSGAVVDSGSFGNVLDDTVKTGEMDIMTIRSNAAKKAWGYRVGAEQERTQGKLAKNAAYYGAMGTLLTGAGQTFGMYKKAKDGNKDA